MFLIIKSTSIHLIKRNLTTYLKGCSSSWSKPNLVWNTESAHITWISLSSVSVFNFHDKRIVADLDPCQIGDNRELKGLPICLLIWYAFWYAFPIRSVFIDLWELWCGNLNSSSKLPAAEMLSCSSLLAHHIHRASSVVLQEVQQKFQLWNVSALQEGCVPGGLLAPTTSKPSPEGKETPGSMLASRSILWEDRWSPARW